MRSQSLVRCPLRSWLTLALLGLLMWLTSAGAQEVLQPVAAPRPRLVLNPPGWHSPAELKAIARLAEARVLTARAARATALAEIQQAEDDRVVAEEKCRHRRGDMDRIEALFRAKAIDRDLLDEVKKWLTESEAAVEIARRRMDRTWAKFHTADARIKQAEAERALARTCVREAEATRLGGDPALEQRLAEAQVKEAQSRLARTRRELQTCQPAIDLAESRIQQAIAERASRERDFQIFAHKCIDQASILGMEATIGMAKAQERASATSLLLAKVHQTEAEARVAEARAALDVAKARAEAAARIREAKPE